MNGINLKLLIIAVVTISLLLIAGSLLIRTLNPIKTPQLPTSQPTPTVNTSQSTSEPTNVQEVPLPVEAVRAPDKATGSGEPFYGEIGGGPAGGQSTSQ